MLVLESVWKTYPQMHALQDINLEVPAGQTKILLGTSGCGKSTILRLMIGLIAPSRGTVSFDGAPVDQQDLLAMRQRMGYVIQDGGLFPHLTARQNAALMAQYLGWSRSKIDQRVDELANLTHLASDSLDRYPVQLSGGQRQRVSLIRALMLDPDIMLMDEPLGALDPITRRDLQEDLREIFRGLGKTVVIVTHDIGEAAYFGDDVILLRDGRIVQQGTMQHLIEQPADSFVTKFINSQRSEVV